jgi:hypothetical protein
VKKRFWAAMFTVIMLATGCTIRIEQPTEENPSPTITEGPSSSISGTLPENNPSSPSPPEGSDSTAPSPEETASEPVGSVSEPEDQNDSLPTSFFEKIEVGTNVDFEYGVFALDNENQLYFGTSNGTMALVDTDVKDFSYTNSGLYVLKENGDVLFTNAAGYQEGQPLTVFYQNSGAEQISDTVLTLSDGSVLSYDSENGSWEPVDVMASSVDADYFGAAIIDTDGILWYLNRETEELTRVAESVIDCSYADRNKVYYSDDLWYITEDKVLHLYQTQPDANSNFSLPNNVATVSGYRGQYLITQTDSSTLLGSLTTAPTDASIKSRMVDLFGTYYAILDEDGDIHFGTLQSQGLEENSLIAHP